MTKLPHHRGVRSKCALFLFLICTSACSRGQSYGIDRGQVDRLGNHPTLVEWEKCENELLYLVRKGDVPAVSAAVKVLPTLLRSDLVTHADWLAVSLWEQADPQPEMLKLPAADLSLLIKYYDKTLPLDWDSHREVIIKRRPDVVPLLVKDQR